MDRPISVSWRASLVTRLASLWVLLLAAIVALFGYLTYRGNTASLVAASRESLTHDARTVSLKLQSAVSGVVRDIVYLSRTATVRAFVQAQGTEQERWKTFVDEDFRALLEGRPSYFQVRIIGLADQGRELVRLDNVAGRIEAMSAERMQQKGDRDYFQAGLRLKPGEVHLSEINLNQDFGRITEPHIPTLRAVMQLADETGGVIALMVINVDLTDTFTDLARLVGSRAQLRIASMNGDYLVHPDAARTFGADLRTGANLLGDFPEAARTQAREPLWLRTIEDGELVLCLRGPLAPGTDRESFIIVALPADQLLRGLHETRNRTARITGLVALGAIGLLVLAVRPTARRLHHVTEEIARYDAGAPVNFSPPPGADEVSVLAGRFAAMAEKVRAQVESLDAARREAEEATRAKEEFLAVMSHEIRTPMNAVIGLLRVLERNKPGAHQEPVLRSLRIAATNLMSLLNDALDFTKLKAGRIEFDRTDFALGELLSDLALQHRPVALQKGLELELELAPDLPAAANGDAVRLTQILNNLVSNALKFTDRGRVRIAAEPAGQGRVRFIVEDTGIGIAPENIERVFAPFMQAHDSSARRFDGAGLGLSIARALVERQGGALEVASKPGEGSRFTVTLPLGRADRATFTSAGDTRVPVFAGRRVLYVEDVASNREVMAATLADTHAELTMAETGAEALEKLRAGTFDIALIDVQLPDTNGPALARAIRAEWPQLPMIAVTAQVADSAAAECRDAGMRGIVLKPIEPRQLFTEMTQHLDGVIEGAISLDGLAQIFAAQPERLRPMLATIAQEFRVHRAELEAAFAGDDLAQVRRVRHKAHSAIEQLSLTELRAVWTEVAEGNTALRPRCLALLDAAARELESRALQSFDAAAPAH